MKNSVKNLQPELQKTNKALVVGGLRLTKLTNMYHAIYLNLS